MSEQFVAFQDAPFRDCIIPNSGYIIKKYSHLEVEDGNLEGHNCSLELLLPLLQVVERKCNNFVQVVRTGHDCLIGFRFLFRNGSGRATRTRSRFVGSLLGRTLTLWRLRRRQVSFVVRRHCDVVVWRVAVAVTVAVVAVAVAVAAVAIVVVIVVRSVGGRFC